VKFSTGFPPYPTICNIAAQIETVENMGYNLLKGKRGIIFGALDENSIAWKTALKVKEEGGIFTLTNAPIAMRMGKINELARTCNAEIIPADATSEQDLNTLFTKSMEILGGKLDFVLHSIGIRQKG
jgi:enoyl-[acyl-carrier protein] reductase I